MLPAQQRQGHPGAGKGLPRSCDVLTNGIPTAHCSSTSWTRTSRHHMLHCPQAYTSHTKPAAVSLVLPFDLLGKAQTLFLCLTTFFIWEFKRQERRETDSPYAPPLTCFPNACIGQHGARPKLEATSLPGSWQKPHPLNHRCCLSGSAKTGSWSQELELSVGSGLFNTDTGVFTGTLATRLFYCFECIYLFIIYFFYFTGKCTHTESSISSLPKWPITSNMGQAMLPSHYLIRCTTRPTLLPDLLISSSSTLLPKEFSPYSIKLNK